MGFQTVQFWIGFGLMFVLYWGMLNPLAERWGRKGIRLRNLGLLLASCLFYASWDPWALTIIGASTVMDYLATRMMTREGARKQVWLGLSLIGNLGMLLAFKYFNFFIDSAESFVNLLTGWDANTIRLDWVLPVGISFYTFQTLGYTLDVYEGKLRPESSFVSFFAFVSFFPQLIAGPIERGADLMPQFQSARTFSSIEARRSVLRILWGLFKKLAIADRLAVFVNAGYADIEGLTGVMALSVVFAFTIQLYCDFSGYCDIAIGSAQLLGFNLSENFRRPLLAKNLQDLWRRWHITIHRWFLEHIYLRLPRYRTKWGRMRNILIIFAISGLWHGASWNMVTWGLINGLLMMVLDGSVFKPLSKSRFFVFRKLGQFWANSVVFLSLVFFRAPTWDDAVAMYMRLGTIFGAEGRGSIISDFENGLGLHPNEIAVGAFLVLLLYTIESFMEHKEALANRVLRGPGFARWGVAFGLGFAIVLLGIREVRPNVGSNNNMEDADFIYEQF